MMHDAEHRVHFGIEDASSAHENNIIIKTDGCKIDIYLGFLQIYHKYEVQLTIAASALPVSSQLIPQLPDPPSLSCGLLDMKRSDSSREEVQLTAELTPSKEKLFCERITLADAANENLRCVLTFHGRILGKGKGTPLLKNGIRCTGVVPDPNESDVNSDWQGF